MKVSIITPSYNQGKFIRDTINSVLDQRVEFEYIIMDGGSTDETISVLKEYEGKLYWESKKDGGQADAVNQGIKKATGDIIGWLNSDDIYYKNTLNTIIEFFTDNPTVNVVYGNAHHIDEQGKFIEEYYTEDFNYERLKDICYICQPSLFFRKSVVDKYGYLNDKLQYCMDYDYWLRLAKGEKFYRINQLFAGSRLYPENKTLGSRCKVHMEIVEMLSSHFKRVPTRWIYALAHTICEEKGIDREASSSSNKQFISCLINESAKLFFKYYGYIPISEIKQAIKWYFGRKG